MTHFINISLPATEVRVLAEPDFPKTIFVEIQTNIMSADGINEMAAQAPKKIPHKTKKLLYQTGYNR